MREEPSIYSETEKLVVSCASADVEAGLGWLVDDDSAKELVIFFTESGDRFVSLWKIKGNDLLGSTSKGIPNSLGLWINPGATN